MFMRKTSVLRLSGLLLAGTPAAATPLEGKGEARLARDLAGRVAGEPVGCIRLHEIQSSWIIDRTAIVYEGRGGTLYVNRPRAGRESLDRFDVLVSSPFGGQLCSIDVVRLLDSTSQLQTGSVFLGPFVPYSKPQAAR